MEEPGLRDGEQDWFRDDAWLIFLYLLTVLERLPFTILYNYMQNRYSAREIGISALSVSQLK
jgi:hypothetical protein